MSSSVKVVLRNRTNKQGLSPLVIRITKNRKSTEIYTGQYIEKKYWDDKNRKVKKSFPNAARLNNLLSQKLAEANKALIDLQVEDKNVSSKEIKKEIVNPLTTTSFQEVSNSYLKELEDTNKLTRHNSDKVRVKYVNEFANNTHLSFREIDESFLRRFKIFLKVKKSNSERSIMNTLVVVRTIYNRAIRLGVIERKYYPFGKDKIRIKFPETEKIGLSAEEVQRIENLETLNHQQNHARNVWLFSFYLAGMRVADVIKVRWSDIYDGRLHYRMNKNDKLLSLKLPEKIFPILEYYTEQKQDEDDFIFPEMKKANLDNSKDVLAKTKTATKKFNLYLSDVAQKAEIKKKLTMHIARHSFGAISGDKISIHTLQKLYRHSSITTTINYQNNFIHKDFDEALDNVVNF